VVQSARPPASTSGRHLVGEVFFAQSLPSSDQDVLRRARRLDRPADAWWHSASHRPDRAHLRARTPWREHVSGAGPIHRRAAGDHPSRNPPPIAMWWCRGASKPAN